MADDTVETAKQAVLHEALDYVDSRETFQRKVDALVAAVRAENDKVRTAADEWQKCARAQATMVEELCERVDVLERKLADVFPELR